MSVRSAAAWCAAFVAAGCSPSEFPCASDEACVQDGAAGVCQSSGYCSFPDEECPSRQRYVEHAPAELSEACVDSSWGLVGRWALDDGGALTARDDSGNGRDGLLVNGPSWTTGIFGGALEFAGNGSRVQVEIDGFGTSSISGSAWVKSTDDRDVTARIFGAAFGAQAYFFIDFKAGYPSLGAKSAESEYWDCGTEDVFIRDGAWHELGFIIDRVANESRFYVNGVVKGRCLRDAVTDTTFGAPEEGSIFVIGAQNDNDALSFVGTVDAVALWARALEDAEMAALGQKP